MKKLGIIMHALGLLSGIVGAYTLRDYGWTVYQWPIITCVWIIASFVSGLSLKQTEGYLNDSYKEISNLRDYIHQKQMDEMKSAFGRTEK